MNRRNVIVGCLLFLIPLTIIVHWFISPVPKPEKPIERIVVKEAETIGAHYISYVQDDTLYVEDMNTQVITPLRRINGNVRQSIIRIKSAPVTSYTYMPGNSLIDPASLQIGIKPSIPYTYDATLEKEFIYLETLLYDGWEIAGYYSDYRYVDCYLKKGNVISRIILLENSMKIFDQIKGDMPNPYTYVS